jgi:hypothetical protein
MINAKVEQHVFYPTKIQLSAFIIGYRGKWLMLIWPLIIEQKK